MSHPPDTVDGAPLLARLRDAVLALLAGAAGGLLCTWLGIPLGWLLGAMVATALAALAGLSPAVPSQLRATVIALLGLLIGSSVDSRHITQARAWLLSVALLALYVLLVAALSLWYLRRSVRLGPYTAFFAAAPGGLSEMVLLSDRVGADMRSVALVHATRVFLIASLIPPLVDWLGGAPQSTMATGIPTLPELLLLALTGLVGSVIGRRLALPAAELTGPMLGSAALHLAGLLTAQLPHPVVIFAQVTIGAAIGSRFRGLRPRRVLAHIVAGLGLTLLMFATTALFALLLHLWTGLCFVALLLAYVPGGVVEMATVAVALGIDPGFVATHHLIRLTLVVFLAPSLFPFWRRWVERRRLQGDAASDRRHP